MSKIPIDNLKQLQAQLFQTKLLSKISIINKQLKAKGMIWRAGETFYSHLSYADKRRSLERNIIYKALNITLAFL